MSKQILLSLLNCSWQWMLLSGLIWFVATRFRRSNATVHLLWLLSLLSLPILFSLNQFVPAPAIGGAISELTQAKPVNVSGLAALTTDLPEFSSAETQAQSKDPLLAGSKSFVNWAKADLLLCVWAIGALTMLIRLMFGLYRIYQLRRSAVLADNSYQSICQRLAQQLNISRQVTVCFSDRVISPISFGWLSPYILIPRKLNLEQFELVAAHELAHVQRFDWLTNLFSHLVGVIFFFHPVYHFLNRELVRVRERVCDDWVIQLTGARKNYAQCLLDLVRHADRVVPLALSLNQPSQLESRIDSILKSNRRLDVQLKPRLQLIVATLLLTCLPLLAMAQLVPLKTFQVSLFAQTPQKSEKTVDKTKKKQATRKVKTERIDEASIAAEFAELFEAVESEKISKAEVEERLEEIGITWEEGKQLLKEAEENTNTYKEQRQVEVADPAGFSATEGSRLFSGPQPGERLPPLKVAGISGGTDGKSFDITAKIGREPLVLFLQDTNAVGIKGVNHASEVLLKIDAIQRRQNNAKDAEGSGQGFQIGIVFLADDANELPDWADEFLGDIPNEVLIGISPDGREGPGSYGLNRNVAQTILIAKDGKVLYNLAFTQPTLYIDPHVLGAVAHAIGEKPAMIEKWLNESAAEGEAMQRDMGKMKGENARDSEQGPSREELVKRFDKDGDGKLNREEEMTARRALENRENQNRYNKRVVTVKNPATMFKETKRDEIFSGPQPGEKLPPLQATGVYGEVDGETFDFILKAGGRPHILLLQDENGVGLRGLYDVAGLIKKIANRSGKDLHMSAVFLGDDPVALKQTASGIAQHVPRNVIIGVSPDGREGPGSYGLNRNVSQTVLIAKDGKVLYNFALTQPMLYADPYVLGAIAQAVDEDPSTVEKWLNEASTEDKQMQRADTSEEAKALGRKLREMVEKGEITGEEARERYEKAFPRNRERRRNAED